jgi:hypothetical protein
MRQETLPDPSDNIWQPVESRVRELDLVREALLTSASHYWAEGTPNYQKDFEVWRMVSGTKFKELLNAVSESDFSNLEKTRFMIGVFLREDQRRVESLNAIAEEDICEHQEPGAFAAKRLSNLVPEVGWPEIISEISEQNQINMDADFLVLFGYN